MNRGTIIALRCGLVVLLLGMLVVQALVLPAMAADSAAQAPEIAYLRWPYLVASITVVACVQLAVLCVWRLLGFVQEGSIFSDRAFTWVDRIIGATVVATVLVLAMTAYLTAINMIPPGLLILLGGAVVGGTSLALLLLVMRALLVRATGLEADLREVI